MKRVCDDGGTRSSNHLFGSLWTIQGKNTRLITGERHYSKHCYCKLFHKEYLKKNFNLQLEHHLAEANVESELPDVSQQNVQRRGSTKHTASAGNTPRSGQK